jgi:Signal transduction histidine kinase
VCFRSNRRLIPALPSLLGVLLPNLLRAHSEPVTDLGTGGGAPWLWLLGGMVVTAAGAAIFWVVHQRALERTRAQLEQARQLELEKLAAAQARQAKEIADSANRAKTEFLATMSHEIRTPLNGVIGSAELMLETPLNAQQREYMTTVRTSAEALLAIVNDILDFSKIEEGKVLLDHARFDLRQPVVDVLKIASAKIGEKNLELVLDFSADVPPGVHGDAARLRQVLLNLVSNAVKFTAQGHVLVRVTRELDPTIAPRVWLRFSVVDTGMGIPAEARVRLFEKFTQADASTTRRFGGTGLGLAISKKLVELMGGQIGVESKPGQGSLFWFTLPMQVEEAAAPVTETSAGPVLIVDDLAVAGVALEGLLNTMQVRAEVAASGAEALERLHVAAKAGAAFEFALVDHSCAAPGGDGWLKAARAAPELQETKFILLAPPNRHRDTATPFPAEFSAMMVKPVLQSEQVAEAMREARGVRTEAVPARETVKLSRRGLRVLVAEDNNVNRVVLGGMLKKLGCVVEFAENGAEAVAKTRLSSHDIIFMDCLMPEMDGWNATLEIRRLDSRTPIVATTANATADDKQRCLKVGMNDYLSKPLRLAEMVRVMERWVG